MTHDFLSHPDRAARRATMAREVREGKQPAAVAIRHGVTLRNVQLACAEHGVKLPGNQRSSVCDILASLLKGKSQAETARDHGVSPQRVHTVATMAKKAGIALNGGGR